MTHHLLLHLAGPGTTPFPTMATALQVAANARTELPGFRVEIVVQGPTVAELAAGGETEDRVRQLLADEGMSISVCANSLRSLELDAATLMEGVAVVPAAVERLTQAQQDGAAYVRI